MSATRSGTTNWKRQRLRVLHTAKATGQTQCPYCKTTLDYSGGPRKPNSAEVDHIIPHSKGGTDDRANLRVICANCNQSKGNRDRPKAATVNAYRAVKTSRKW